MTDSNGKKIIKQSTAILIWIFTVVFTPIITLTVTSAFNIPKDTVKQVETNKDEIKTHCDKFTVIEKQIDGKVEQDVFNEFKYNIDDKFKDIKDDLKYIRENL